LVGAVEEKYIDDEGNHLIDVSLTGSNQTNEMTTLGAASIQLPPR
jgi:hypothetical protein